MKQSVLWKISVTTTPEAEDAVTQLLERAFGQPASSYIGAETGGAVVSVYVPTRPDWSKATQKELAEVHHRLQYPKWRLGQWPALPVGLLSLFGFFELRFSLFGSAWFRFFRTVFCIFVSTCHSDQWERLEWKNTCLE